MLCRNSLALKKRMMQAERNSLVRERAETNLVASVHKLSPRKSLLSSSLATFGTRQKDFVCTNTRTIDRASFFDFQHSAQKFLLTFMRITVSLSTIPSEGFGVEAENMLCAIGRAKISAWFQNYDNVQSLAVLFLYLQVGCALIGSCSASYMGLLVANLAIALFALIAIESGSQKLGRTYAVLLVCALLLDIAWFVLFSVEIRQIQSQPYVGTFTIFSLQLVLWMQIIGFLVRFLSAFLWLHMYRLGATSAWGGLYQPLDLERRIASFGLPTPGSSPRTTTRQSSLSDEILGGSIYNPAHYSSHFGPPDEVLSIKEVKEGGVL